MKLTLHFFLVLAIASFFTACNDAPAGEKVEAGEKIETTEATTAEAASYAVNTENSKINWVGTKLVGKKHVGHITLKEGSLKVANDQLVGGTFVIDMSTITTTDLAAGDGKEDLEGHLMSGDFFDVANFPTATFEIAEVAAATGNAEATHNITGNLTLRGETKSVTIPAKVSMADGKVSASTPQFVIDRTQWGASYGSSALGVAQDKVINDEIGLTIELIAGK